MQYAKERSEIKIYDVLFAIQIFAFFILFLSEYLAPGLTQLAYCVAVYFSPLLLIVYGHCYLYGEKLRLEALIPFFTELALSVLFVMVMIYGIQTFSRPEQSLFIRLLTLYAVDVIICLLGTILAVCGRPHKAAQCR